MGSRIKDLHCRNHWSGIAFLDYDNDGFSGIFVVSGPGGSNRLYHNDQKGTLLTHRQMAWNTLGWGKEFARATTTMMVL